MLSRTRRAQLTLEVLEQVIEKRSTELRHVNPFELLVATVLSAQCTDERVNMVTPSLFRAFPDAESLARASEERVLDYIKSVTYPNSKSRHLVGLARKIVNEFDGKVPDTVESLKRLPGVGQKTAQVVAGEAFAVPTLAVDTHVFRIAHRIGLVRSAARTPAKVERQLKRLLPKDRWREFHHLLIFHGRATCRARDPECTDCVVGPHCRHYGRLKKLPAPRSGLNPSRGRYYCATRNHYFDRPDRITDRYDTEQISCPRCGSMNVFLSKTGRTTRQIQDFRV